MVGKKKAKRKASKPWSKDELKLLKKLYPTGSTQEIADKTGRSPALVRQKAFCMKIKKKRIFYDWPADEIKLLKKLYPTTKDGKIAVRLGRSERSVKMKAFLLDLQKKPL